MTDWTLVPGFRKVPTFQFNEDQIDELHALLGPKTDRKAVESWRVDFAIERFLERVLRRKQFIPYEEKTKLSRLTRRIENLLEYCRENKPFETLYEGPGVASH